MFGELFFFVVNIEFPLHFQASDDKKTLYQERGLQKEYDYVFEDLSEMFVATPSLADSNLLPPPPGPVVTEADRRAMTMAEVRKSLPVYPYREQVFGCMCSSCKFFKLILTDTLLPVSASCARPPGVDYRR